MLSPATLSFSNHYYTERLQLLPKINYNFSSYVTRIDRDCNNIHQKYACLQYF